MECTHCQGLAQEVSLSRTFALMERIDLPDADILYWPQFLDPPEADKYFDLLRSEIAWRQDRVHIFGKWVDQPRLSAWYGDPGRTYRYSGLILSPLDWTDTLLDLKARVDAEAGQRFNSVLLNLYRNGRDSIGWHSDNEPELGPEPVIASLSLGAERKFQLRHKEKKSLKHTLELTHGSLLIMRGPTQHHWEHAIPKTTKEAGERINLTFRKIG